MAPEHIPELSTKLKELYSRHPEISGHGALATRLGLTPQNINAWIAGNATRREEHVPLKHVARICDVFGISLGTFRHERLEDFRADLDNAAARPGAWERLANRAVFSEALVIRTAEQGRIMTAVHKGLVPEDDEDEPPLERFGREQRLYLGINMDEAQSDAAVGRFAYCLVLVADRLKVYGLMPHPRLTRGPGLTTRQAAIWIPDPEVYGQPLKFSGAAGEQTLYAVFTAAALPDAFYASLEQPQTHDLLDQLAMLLGTSPLDDHAILAKAFEFG